VPAWLFICLERGADLHMAQLMPLPFTVCCFSKIQIGFTFLVPLTWVVPEKGPLNGCVCVCMCVCVRVCVRVYRLRKRKANMASNIHSHQHLMGPAIMTGGMLKIEFPHLRFSTLVTWGPQLLRLRAL